MTQADQKMQKCPQKLLGRMREAIRLKHYSIRTEDACVAWIKRGCQEQLGTPWTDVQGVAKSVS